MVTTREQYEAFPYPERDPGDEAKRLIVGSPSHPLEVDHHLFGGHRDWSKPLRALAAGGGTGDGMVQLAAVLAQAGRPYEITYLDLSTASRRIAEARIKARGLDNVTFVTGSLLDAAEHGPFDYIDCCGVLHHLPDPAAGFRALRDALAPGGGLGFMVYAPYGRSGVYPLQEAFGALLDGLPPAERLAQARAIVATLPAGHPFVTNPNLTDHLESDAGFYDLLLHGQDRAFDVAALLEVLAVSGWSLANFTTPALYDLARIATVPDGMTREMAMQTAEKLRGTIRMHVAYAVPTDANHKAARGNDRTLVPHLKGVGAKALAQAVARGKPIPVREGAVAATITLPKAAASVIAGIDGRRRLGDIAAALGMDPLAFGAVWAPVEKELTAWGLLLYSDLLRR